jgi:uncharacterized metal-binding protein YceD (DUF177 family)
MTDDPLFSHHFDLATLPRDGAEEYFEVSEAACRAIAAAFSVNAIEDFTARLNISRVARDEFQVEGNFKATVGQTCIVTLQPIRTRLDQDVTRRYRLVARGASRSRVEDVAVDEDATEIIESTRIDLAAPVLEELSLAIDPYPRLEGAEFENAAKDEAAEDSPFAVLKALKGNEEKS